MRPLRPATRLIVVLVAVGPSACRTAAEHSCVPERGAEVWVERRYPAPTLESTAPASLASLRLGPDTTPAVMAARQPRVWIIGPAGTARPDTILGGGRSPQGHVGLPSAAGTLRPGRYRVRLIEIGWVGATRDIVFGAGERVDLEVELRRAAYCLGPVIVTALQP